jgi:hypothetical protein
MIAPSNHSEGGAPPFLKGGAFRGERRLEPSALFEMLVGVGGASRTAPPIPIAQRTRSLQSTP